MPVRVGIFLIASPIIVLAWLKKNENMTNEIDYSAVLTTCRLSTSEMSFSSANSLVSDDNA